MSLFADPAQLDALATRIESHAHAVRRSAHRLGQASARVDWHGLAARSFAGSADDTVGALLLAARGLDAAAATLRRHAAAVRLVIADLQALERTAEHAVSEAGGLVAGGLRSLGDALHV